jgi:hypothetical protein
MSEDDDTSDRFYNFVLRQVLWGSGRDEIFHHLEANGITGEKANKIYDCAVRERIATIRGGYAKRIAIGGMLMVAGLVLFAGIAFLTEGFKVFNIVTIAIPAGISTFGAWKFFSGVIGIVTASSRTGPISEID